jgi:rod shape determining protein RodA
MRQRYGVFDHIDWWLVIIFIFLVVIGWLNIYAAVFDENHISILDMHVKYGKQLAVGARSIIPRICDSSD